MTNNFRGKKNKDIESASDTIIHNTDFSSSILNKSGSGCIPNIASQHVIHDNFDSFIEKKNKKL